MRHACLAAFLTALWIPVAGAFEIEDERRFGTGPDVLRILSTADLAIFTPLIERFGTLNPAITVHYVVASSTETMKAIMEEEARFDLVISSAMDLQTKLANDGFARPFRSEATAALPPWARWRDQLFAFTQEPSVLVIHEPSFEGLTVPESREDLISLLRDHPDRFRGRIGTYDVRRSGLGYLFATQDSRNSESFWRLTEIMGGLGARLYCCSNDMIADVVTGRLAFAYNVLGSYLGPHLDARDSAIRTVEFSDVSNLMLRTVLIPRNAANIRAAGRFIIFLVEMHRFPEIERQTGLTPINSPTMRFNNAFRPIRLGPGLLVFLDRMKRANFLRSWTGSIERD